MNNNKHIYPHYSELDPLPNEVVGKQFDMNSMRLVDSDDHYIDALEYATNPQVEEYEECFYLPNDSAKHWKYLILPTIVLAMLVLLIIIGLLSTILYAW